MFDCMNVYAPYACLVPMETEEDARSPELKLEYWEAPYECQEPNLGPQWEQEVLLAIEPSLQHLEISYIEPKI